MIKNSEIKMLDNYHYSIRHYLGIRDKDDVPEVDEVIIRARKKYKYTRDIIEECKCILQIGINGHGNGQNRIQ